MGGAGDLRRIVQGLGRLKQAEAEMSGGILHSWWSNLEV